MKILQSASGMRQAEVYRVAVEKEKELTDRALKLAGVGKPKSNWELQEVLGVGAFALRTYTAGLFIKCFRTYVPHV